MIFFSILLVIFFHFTQINSNKCYSVLLMKCSSFFIILIDDLEILAIAPKTIKTIDHEERRSFAGLALWPGLFT